ncbi:DUF6252 domain-containing protein [Spirosoma areae]
MKTSRIVTLLAIIGIVGVSSCSKKADDVTPGQAQNPGQTPTQTQAGFRVKVDGTTYAPDFSYALATFPGGNGYYAIYGLDSKTNDVVAIALPNTVGEGTYPINNVNFGVLTYNKEDFSTINAGSGTITITKKTTTNLIGTFSFTAYDPTGAKKRVLTDGAFNVTVR